MFVGPVKTLSRVSSPHKLEPTENIPYKLPKDVCEQQYLDKTAYAREIYYSLTYLI